MFHRLTTAKLLTVFSALFFVALAQTIVAVEEKSIVVVIPSYNNEEWVEKNLETLFAQEYDNYRVIYIDDLSTDNTVQLVKQMVRDHDQSHRFQLIENTVRVGALENLYHAIHSCHDDEIIVTYDGDDWFPHERVLKIVGDTYSKNNVWLTHGSYTTYPDGGVYGFPYSKKAIKKHKFRRTLPPSHLRTFYCWLFKKIDVDDLKYEGEFYSSAWDLAMMFPMIEMAAERHAFISEPLYVYNLKNPISDYRVHREEQLKYARHIKNLPPYKRLKS